MLYLFRLSLVWKLPRNYLGTCPLVVTRIRKPQHKNIRQKPQHLTKTISLKMVWRTVYCTSNVAYPEPGENIKQNRLKQILLCIIKVQLSLIHNTNIQQNCDGGIPIVYIFLRHLLYLHNNDLYTSGFLESRNMQRELFLQVTTLVDLCSRQCEKKIRKVESQLKYEGYLYLDIWILY